MTKALSVFVFSFLSATAFSQTVATISNKPILAKEFLWVYKKNHEGNAALSYENLEDYLQLYINFKLKVMEARGLKMDKDTAYVNEIRNYEQIIKTTTKSRLRKEEYEFLLNEYRDGVLLFNISEKKIWTPRRSDAGAGMTEAEQQQLDKEWITELRKKYQIKIDEVELRKLAKP